MDIPSIGPIAAATIILQFTGLMLWVQFSKGKVFPEQYTPLAVTGASALIAAADILAPIQAQWILNLFLLLFGGATGGWAVTKVAQQNSPRNPPGAP